MTAQRDPGLAPDASHRLPQPRPETTALAAYALADLEVPPNVRRLQLAQNESPYPPSAMAIQAASEALALGHLYPSTDHTQLRTAIAKSTGGDWQRTLCGAGSMELIGALIRAYAGPGDEVLAPAHAYGFFRTATAIAGAAYVTAPEDETLTVSVDALLGAVTPRTRIVCIANPGNPTGTWLPSTEVLRLRDGLPDDVLLLLDEAYAEFSPDPGLSKDLVTRGNTVISRTFSKAYGLAGMRVGWMLVPPGVGETMRKLLNPNNVTGIAETAASAAALDAAYMQNCVARITATRHRFSEGLHAMGLRSTDSHANFVLVRFDTTDIAKRADKALRAQGIVTRPQAGHGLPECLRITIGTDDQMDQVALALQAWIAGGQQ